MLQKFHQPVLAQEQDFLGQAAMRVRQQQHLGGGLGCHQIAQQPLKTVVTAGRCRIEQDEIDAPLREQSARFVRIGSRKGQIALRFEDVPGQQHQLGGHEQQNSRPRRGEHRAARGVRPGSRRRGAPAVAVFERPGHIAHVRSSVRSVRPG
jgi:hypothetical protein